MSSPTAAARPAAPRATRPRRLFFPAMALLLAAAVVAGFWNTLYAPCEPLRPYLLVHGIAVSAWFALFATQTLLVASGRTALHRGLGLLGLWLAVAVVATGLYTLAQMPENWRQQGIDIEARRGLLGLVLWGDLGALAAFATLLACAVRKRKQPDAHRRLMLLAMFAIISPALIRVAGLPAFAGFDGVLLTMLGLFALGATLVAYDLATQRRVHRVTRWGVPYFLVVHLVPAFTIPGTALDAAVLGLIW
jgi:hypothetical protein